MEFCSGERSGSTLNTTRKGGNLEPRCRAGGRHWKINKRKHQGKRGFLLKEGQGDQTSITWGMREDKEPSWGGGRWFWLNWLQVNNAEMNMEAQKSGPS